MFEKKSEKGHGNLEHRAGLDWAELGWAELGLAQLSLAQLDLAHPGYFLHTCLRNKRKMPREPEALGWAGLVWATFCTRVQEIREKSRGNLQRWAGLGWATFCTRVREIIEKAAGT